MRYRNQHLDQKLVIQNASLCPWRCKIIEYRTSAFQSSPQLMNAPTRLSLEVLMKYLFFMLVICLSVSGAYSQEKPLLTNSSFCLEPRYAGMETERNPRSEQIELNGIEYQKKIRQKVDEGSRLILHITADGRAILNPKTGSTKSCLVDLKTLTRDKAKMLWGEPHAMTYDLISFSRNEMDVYHLDLCFANGKLNQYKVRGIGISKPEYQYVE